MKQILKFINFFFSIFLYYPSNKLIRPNIFDFESFKINKNKNKKLNICFQLNYDNYFFLLFGALFKKLKEKRNIAIEAIVCESVTASVGFNFKSFIFRNPFFIWLKSSQYLRVYTKHLDINVAYRSSSWLSIIPDVILLSKAYKIWKYFILNYEKSFSLVYKNIEIGDLVIETYLRFRRSPKFSPNDLFVLKIIWQAIIDIENLNKYFKNNSIDLFITSYTCYLTHGIPTRVAIENNIRTLSFGNFQSIGKVLKKNDDVQTHNCKNFKESFNEISKKEIAYKLAEKKLSSRLKGEKDDAIFYMKKTAYHGKKININLKKKAAIIYLHDFFESPHQHKNFIFPDYWTWLLFTVKIFKKNNINFYLKKHPNQLKINDKVILKLKNKIPDENWLPDNITTTQLINDNIISCGITAKGTIAHELAFFGIHSICCSEHSHIAFNFCKTAKNLIEYEDFLKNCHKPPISAEDMKNQALAFYYMYNLHGSKKEVLGRKKFSKLVNACWYYEGKGNQKLEVKKYLNDLYEDEYFKNLCDKENII